MNSIKQNNTRISYIQNHYHKDGLKVFFKYFVKYITNNAYKNKDVHDKTPNSQEIFKTNNEQQHMEKTSGNDIETAKHT